MKETTGDDSSQVAKRLAALQQKSFSTLDLLRHSDLREKLIDLVLNGLPPSQDQEALTLFRSLAASITEQNVEKVRVVVFGGGTGLSNIVGGDSRSTSWRKHPFSGLKEIFPRTTSVVCVTDDGGSTGELLKDLPLAAVGDVRHVLLSSVKLNNLQQVYQLSVSRTMAVAAFLASLFNYRFAGHPGGSQQLLISSGIDLQQLPRPLRSYLIKLLDFLFADSRLQTVLTRPHCLGNLLIVAAIYRQLPCVVPGRDPVYSQTQLAEAMLTGLGELADRLGADRSCIYPCTPTPAQLRLRYTNGIEIAGEAKSSKAKRGFPVDRVYVDFCDEPVVYPEVFSAIAEADIIVLAPGSLYSSIIPVFKVPGLAEAVRENHQAMKILVANLWVQAGETDLSMTDPERKFHVSDMIRAYERNIPGGTQGLFSEVLCLSLQDVPASVIQNYAVEGKVPIYLDKEVVRQHGYLPVECDIFSRDILLERGVIQHDPAGLAQAVKALYAGRTLFDAPPPPASGLNPSPECNSGGVSSASHRVVLPCHKYRQISARLAAWQVLNCTNGEGLDASAAIRQQLCDLIWKHYDIPLAHLDYTAGIACHASDDWPRDQQYDNVFSFFDPESCLIRIRQEQFTEPLKLEVALLIALGQSLLGNYAERKELTRIDDKDPGYGKVYHLFVRSEVARQCFFTAAELDQFLRLARMVPVVEGRHYSRLINGDEGFTPPGLLMGLIYAWYLENRLASHIEYKMSAMRIPQTDLIPEQKRMIARRSQLVSFFREVVFR